MAPTRSFRLDNLTTIRVIGIPKTSGAQNGTADIQCDQSGDSTPRLLKVEVIGGRNISCQAAKSQSPEVTQKTQRRLIDLGATGAELWSDMSDSRYDQETVLERIIRHMS